MKDYLPQASLLRLLVVLLFIAAPHLPRLPLWESATIVLLTGWRALAARRQWRMPPTVLKAAMAFAGFAAVYASYGRISGQTAGVALLVLMLTLKLTELRARRDVLVAVSLLYFLLATLFLASQEIWTMAYLLIGSVAITTLLIDVHHVDTPVPLRQSLRLAAVMSAQAAPLMLLLFVLFPRIPGPIWSLPEEEQAARTGLSDRMSPGDITRLAQSQDLAFRVRFSGAVPPQNQRYWRGPVFWFFDGRAWQAGYRGRLETAAAPAEFSGEPYDYEVMLESTGKPWLLALDLPDPQRRPQNSRIDIDHRLIAAKPVRERQLYTARSYTDYRLQTELPAFEREATLRLPRTFNPRALALSQQWRQRHGDDAQAIVAEALRMFREQNFVYTLEPPALGRDSVDEFLFSTRRGFCEHYAGSFAVLMRAAGIPARVVTGYQGGEKSVVGNWYNLRQSDAHAWNEVWLPQRGWLRVDPTAAVSPSRIERGAQAALEDLSRNASRSGSWNLRSLRYQLEARWDWANAQWNRFFLAYGNELQFQLLSRFGLDSWRAMILALTFSLIAVLLVVGWLVLRETRSVRSEDFAQKQWRSLQRHLRLPANNGEGPRDYIERAASAHPHQAAALNEALQAYLQLRYEGRDDADTRQRLKASVAELKHSRAI